MNANAVKKRLLLNPSRIRRKIIVLLFLCLTVIVICNFYLIHLHTESQFPNWNSKNNNLVAAVGTTSRFDRRNSSVIRRRIKRPDDAAVNKWNAEEFLTHRIRIDERNLNASNAFQMNKIWRTARKWARPYEVYPNLRETNANDHLNRILSAMVYAPIVGAGAGHGGTQLKVTLKLFGNQKAVFKPMRYSRDAIFNDTPYAGADRHNGEIAAFHLSRILDLRWSPLTVGRKIDLDKEIIPVADSDLLKTFTLEGNDTCFYGICYYCKAEELACGNGTTLEGALILWINENYKLKAFQHPWRRTYKRGKKAAWETDDTYCQKVKKRTLFATNDRRLLDLVDAAVFDFLIGNADRHRYEVIDGYKDAAVLLLDNGKSFGDPHSDEVSILAPLYQCCAVRSSTWERLTSFADFELSGIMRDSLANDPTTPVLNPDHLAAMDRRLNKVVEIIQMCFRRHGRKNVLRHSKIGSNF